MISNLTFREKCSVRRTRFLLGHCADVIRRKCSSNRETFYDLLEIPEKASQAQIKAAYYRLSKKYHPDTSKELNSRYKFARLTEAYKTLSNVKHRRDYDRTHLGHKTSSTFTSSTDDIDPEYREFLRRRGTPFKSHPNQGGYQTGRTQHFNFDEFNRMHYGEAVRKSHYAKKCEETFHEDIANESRIYRRNVALYVLFTVGIALFIFKKLR